LAVAENRSQSNSLLEAVRQMIGASILPAFVVSIGAVIVITFIAPNGLVLPGIGLLILLLLSSTTQWRSWKDILTPTSGILVLLAAWSLICALWSPDIGHGLQQISVLGFAVLPALFSRALQSISLEEQSEATRVLTWLYLVLLLLLGLGLMKAFPLTEYRGIKMKYNLWPLNRGMVFVALLCPILCYAASATRAPLLLIAGLAVASTCIIFASHSETAMLVIAIALPVYFLARYGRSWFVPLALFVTVVLFLSFPAVVKPIVEYFKTTSFWANNEGAVESRALFWVPLAELPFKAPLTGLGVEFVRFYEFVHPLTNAVTSVTHPHTILLQLWIDLGLIGVALVLVFLARFLLFSEAVKMQGGEMTIVLTLSVLVALAVSHGIWQPWFASLVVLSACVLLLAANVVPLRSTQETIELSKGPTSNMLRDMDWLFWPASFTLLGVLLVMGRQQFSGIINHSAWTLAPSFLVASAAAFTFVRILGRWGYIAQLRAMVVLFALLATALSVVLNFLSGNLTVIPRSVPVGLILIFPVFAYPLAGKSLEQHAPSNTSGAAL
jgi:O-antigen ligase